MATDKPQSVLGTIVQKIAGQFTPAQAVDNFFAMYPPNPIVGDLFDGRVGYRDVDSTRVASGIADQQQMLGLLDKHQSAYNSIPEASTVVGLVKSLLGAASVDNHAHDNDIYTAAKTKLSALATNHLPDALAALPPEKIADALKAANRSASDNTFLLDWAVRHDSAPLVTAILKSGVKLEIPHVPEADLDKEYDTRATLELPAFLARQAMKTVSPNALAALTTHFGTDVALKGLDRHPGAPWQDEAIPAVANNNLEKALMEAELLGGITPDMRKAMTDMGVKVKADGSLPITNDAVTSADEIKIAGAIIGKTPQDVAAMDGYSIASAVRDMTSKASLGK